MTERELNEVRELKKQIQVEERRLQALRAAAENLVPILDGMPHAKNRKSRVANIAALIIEEEQSLNKMRENVDNTSAELAEKIRNEPLTSREKEILILRYVACMNFRDIEFKLHLSDARIFYLHRSALRKIKVRVQ